MYMLYSFKARKKDIIVKTLVHSHEKQTRAFHYTTLYLSASRIPAASSLQ